MLPFLRGGRAVALEGQAAAVVLILISVGAAATISASAAAEAATCPAFKWGENNLIVNLSKYGIVLGFVWLLPMHLQHSSTITSTYIAETLITVLLHW